MEKQRDGAKNQTYGLHTRFDMCDLITGKYYDPKATVTKEGDTPEGVDMMNVFEKDKKPVLTGNSDEEKLDSLVKLFKETSKKEDHIKADHNIELKRPTELRNNDVLDQYKIEIDKLKKEKIEIASQAQALIKKIDPKASEILLKEMEKSYSDLQKTDSPLDQVEASKVVIERYRLGLKGKLT